jgi:predicted DsbA family dithiol-disulfide isomerase
MKVMAMTDTTSATPADERLRVDLWTDLVCPWCYVGKKRLETAIDKSEFAGRVDLVLHSFELDPGAAAEPTSVTEMLAKKYGRTPEDAARVEGQIKGLAEAEGLPFSSDRLNANTLAVHRLMKLAEQSGVANEFFTAAQRGYFSGEENPFDEETLIRAAVEAGVPEADAREVLAGDAFTEEVRRDEALGKQLGVTGVPFTVFDARLGAAGAQSVEVYLSALQQAFGGK